jgi:tRNA ligase
VSSQGKTIVGLALTELFGWGHIQNDDITTKKTAKTFCSQVKSLLQTSDVVFADRLATLFICDCQRFLESSVSLTVMSIFVRSNNHLAQHRDQLADIAKQLAPRYRVRTVALVWDILSLPQNELHRICTDRIVSRGDNHQSLRPSETREHEGVVDFFISDYQAFDPAFNKGDGSLDQVIDINVEHDPLTALGNVTSRLCELLEMVAPDREELEAALDRAKNFKASIRKNMDYTPGGRGGQKARYYGVALEVDLTALLRDFYSKHPDVDRTLFDELVSKNRVERRPHVTLVHSKEVTSEASDKRDLWERCRSLAEQNLVVEVSLGPRLVWDDRVLSIQVESIKPADLFEKAHVKSHHVTVGTVKEDIRPVEGKLILEALLDGKERQSEEGGPIRFAEFAAGTARVSGRVRGLS